MRPEWQNPVPQGNDLHDVEFVDANVGWAVGKGGIIMRTTDGGAGWTIQNSGTPFGLLGLAVRDGQTAIAVGDRGTIVKTVDGGATWGLRPAPGPNLLIDVAYAPDNPSVIFAVGLDGTVLKSEDGGDAWRRTTPLGNVGLRGVQFVNERVGYILGAGANLAATRDGGATWTQLPTPKERSIRSFVFTGEASGFAVGDGGLLLRTGDGGETWTALVSPTAADLYSVAAVDERTMHAVGDGGTIVKSVDGGATWAQLPEPRPASTKLVRIVAIPGTQGQRAFVVGFNGTQLRTADAGVSWTSLSTSPRGTLRSVKFVTQDTVVAVGERGTIVKSVDRGNTWRPVRSGTQRDLNDVQFFTRQIGFAVGDGGTILRSDDTGETWRQVKSPVGLNLRAIGLAGDPETGRLDVGLIGGDTNLVLRSTDQGNSWLESRLPGGNDRIYSVHFPEPRVGYVGGLQTIWQTTDFGRTWRVVAGGQAAPRDPLGFSFPSVNRGFAVGQQGQIFRTDDGGTTWTRQTSGTTQRLRGVQFQDENTGYAVGDDGTILVTNNGGDTWRPVNSGTHLAFWRVQFISAGVGLAVGEGGVVLKTVSAGLPTHELPPAVAAVSPTDNQTNVVDERVRITFTKDISFSPGDYAELGRLQLRDLAGRFVPGTASYDAGNREVQLRPAQPLPAGGTYTLTVAGGEGGVTDLEGRRMIFSFRSTFRTACELESAGGFGKLIALDVSVRDRIGCPLNEGHALQAVEQVFERGHMLWRGDARQIVVSFFNDGRWATFADTYREGETLSRSRAPEGLLVPERGFGKLWREQPGLRDRLGWAVGPERKFDGWLQDYSGGYMVWTGSEQWLVRVHFADGTTSVAVDPNTPPETSTIPAGFLEQSSAVSDCTRYQSVSAGCLEFPDGYIWPVSDTITGQEEHGEWQGRKIVAFVGQKATYEHILGTRLVRIVPKAPALPTPTSTPAR
ncbi:MAG TPA: YCF48-related protein [Chloroflexota bacterium]|nr:YCF48-related protein [Chloroflexota bacterium]